MGQVVVAHHENRVAPPLGEVEGEQDQLDRLGRVGRGEHDVPVVPVTAPSGCLEVVPLRSGHVEDDQGKAGEGDLGQRLLHEGKALAGRSRRRGHAGGRRPPRHPDGLELALRVHAHSADLGEPGGHLLEHLGERGHRVPGEEAAPGGDHRLGDGLAPLEQAALRCGGRGHAVPPEVSIGVWYL